MTNLAVPVKPALPHLPFLAISWEDFQRLCCQILGEREEIKSCKLLGVPGNKQYGIDAEIKSINGQKWGGQFKRVKEFPPSEARKAIQKAQAEYRAQQYILAIARPATTKTRKMVQRYRKWELLDSEDIEQQLRSLPNDKAKQIIRQFFGFAWVHEFLDSPTFSPFKTHLEYFEPYLRKGRLFVHTLPLIGRKPVLDKFKTFFGNPSKRAAILIGRGGLGKSRLLLSFAKAVEDVSAVRIAEGTSPITPNNLEDLPNRPLIVFVEDVHKQDNLSQWLSDFYRLPNQPKLILSTRPYEINHLHSVLREAGYDSNEISELPLPEFQNKDLLAIARAILRPGKKSLSGQLVAASSGLPLIIVVGAGLINEEQVDVAALANHKGFQANVLSKFEEFILGTIPGNLDQNICKKSLGLLAALAPFPMDSEKLVTAASEFLEIAEEDFIEQIGILEASQVVIRNQNGVSITPDLLSEHILRTRCIAPTGRINGYANKLFEKFWEIHPKPLMANLSLLDWDIYQEHKVRSPLLKKIWESIFKSFADSSNSHRVQILLRLIPAAPYQTASIIKLVKFAMQNPSTVAEPASIPEAYRAKHESVMRTLPELLDEASYSLECLPELCGLLWELGRDDETPARFGPNQSIRVLQRLAFCHPDKPVSAVEEVVDILIPWLRSAHAGQHRYSVLDILGETLKRSAASFRPSFQRIPVAFEEVKEVRKKVLNAVFQEVDNNQPHIINKVLRVLENVLRPDFGDIPTESIQAVSEQWLPERLEVIKCFARLIQTASPSWIKVRVMEILQLYLHPLERSEIRSLTKSTLDSIKQDSIELDIALHISMLHQSELFDASLFGKPQATEQYRDRVLKVIVDKFINQYPDAAAGLSVIEATYTSHLAADLGSNFGPLLWTIGLINPDYAYNLSLQIHLKPQSPLAKGIGSLLMNAKLAHPTETTKLVKLIIKEGQSNLCLSIAASLPSLVTSEEEYLKHLKKLITHPDAGVLSVVTMNIHVCKPSLHLQLLTQLDKIKLPRNPDIAANFFHWVNRILKVSPEVLPPELTASFIKKLVEVDSIKDNEVLNFLKWSFLRLPKEVARLLIERIMKDNGTPFTTYSPLPHEQEISIKGSLVDKSAQVAILELLLDTYQSAQLDKPYKFRDIATVFSWFSNAFQEPTMEVIQNWYGDGSKAKLQSLASLFLHASLPAELFFKHTFIRKILVDAKQISSDLYQEVCNLFGRLASSVIYHARKNNMDLLVAEKLAQEALRGEEPGSPIYDFFQPFTVITIEKPNTANELFEYEDGLLVS